MRLATLALHQLQLGADQVLGRGEHREKRKRADGEHRFRGGSSLDQRLVEGELDRFLGDADAARRIALRVGIEKQGTPLGHGETTRRH